MPPVSFPPALRRTRVESFFFCFFSFRFSKKKRRPLVSVQLSPAVHSAEMREKAARMSSAETPYSQVSFASRSSAV